MVNLLPTIIHPPRWRAAFSTRSTRLACILAGGIIVVSGLLTIGKFPIREGSSLLRLDSFNLPPVCKRTLLIDWGSFENGFGSTYNIILQAAYFAKQNDYTMIFTRGSNNYGRYSDYYVTTEADCYLPESAHDIVACRESPGCVKISHAIEALYRGEALEVNHYYLTQSDCLPFNRMLLAHYLWPDFNTLSDLPQLSSQSVFPSSSAVPPQMYPFFRDFSELSAKHFSYNDAVKNEIASVRRQLTDVVDIADITIGVQYRGGDKIRDECSPNALISCGNITLHSEVAYDSYLAVVKSLNIPEDPPRRKPKLLLMTVEPVFEDFKLDPIGSLFDVIVMPTSDEGDRKSFDQKDFNSQLIQDRIVSTRSMLAALEIFALHLDSAIVSTNSNMGRMAMLRGGEMRWLNGVKVRPVDLYYFPSLWKVVWPKCDGTENLGCA